MNQRLRTIAIFSAILFAAMCAFSCSASGQKGWIGTWRGTVIFVNVEYVFTESTFEMKTTSANNVVVAAAKGPLRVEGDTMYITESDRYFFDTNTNIGEWRKSTDNYKASIKLNGTQLTFQPETSKIALELTKQ